MERSLPSSQKFLTALLQTLSELDTSLSNEPNSANDNNETVSFHQSRGELLPGNRLNEIREQIQPLLLTLHALFPSILLPALDLLDRQLVSCLCHESLNAAISSQNANPGRLENVRLQTLAQLSASLVQSHRIKYLRDASLDFYVRSAAPAPIRTRRSETGREHEDTATESINVQYQVRLGAWTCSCPAFLASSFGAMSLVSDGLHNQDLDLEQVETSPHDWHSRRAFGGIRLEKERSPPLCKHLMACLLAVHSPYIFGSHVPVRPASSLQMAAWAAGWTD